MRGEKPTVGRASPPKPRKAPLPKRGTARNTKALISRVARPIVNTRPKNSRPSGARPLGAVQKAASCRASGQRAAAGTGSSAAPWYRTRSLYRNNSPIAPSAVNRYTMSIAPNRISWVSRAATTTCSTLNRIRCQ